jgi:hypothetical protein
MDDHKIKLLLGVISSQLKNLHETLEDAQEDLDAWYDNQIHTSKVLYHSFPYLYTLSNNLPLVEENLSKHLENKKDQTNIA